MHEELEHSSTRDPLTQLHNRRAFDSQLRIALERTQTSSTTTSLILLDIDDFKAINDSFGHDKGDEVLKTVAAAIRASLRDGDVSCRIGGEEFATVLTEIDAARTTELAERIRVKVAETGAPVGRPVTVSIGVVCTAGGTPESVYRSADQALYRAKTSGKNRVFVAEEHEPDLPP